MFFHELERVRELGYALDLEENEYGIRCVVVPIFDHTKQVIAAVSVSGPTIRMTDERLEQLHVQMKKIGKQISKRLGYR